MLNNFWREFHTAELEYEVAELVDLIEKAVQTQSTPQRRMLLGETLLCISGSNVPCQACCLERVARDVIQNIRNKAQRVNSHEEFSRLRRELKQERKELVVFIAS